MFPKLRIRVEHFKKKTNELSACFSLLNADGTLFGPESAAIHVHPEALLAQAALALSNPGSLAKFGETIRDLLPEDLIDQLRQLEHEARTLGYSTCTSAVLLIDIDPQHHEQLFLPWDLARIDFTDSNDYLLNRFATGFICNDGRATTTRNLKGLLITNPSTALDTLATQYAARATPEASPFHERLLSAIEHRDALEALVAASRETLAGAVDITWEGYRDKTCMDDWVRLIGGAQVPQNSKPNLLFYMGHWEMHGDNPEGALQVSYKDTASQDKHAYTTDKLPVRRIRLAHYDYPVLFLGCCGADQAVPETPVAGDWQWNNVRAILSFARTAPGARAYIAPRGPVDAEVTAMFARHFFSAILQTNASLGWAFQTARQRTSTQCAGLAEKAPPDEKPFRRWQEAQVHLFTCCCSDPAVWHSRLTLPTLHCTVIYPLVNQQYYDFFAGISNFDLPCELDAVTKARDFDDVCYSVQKHLDQYGNDPEHLLLADMTVLAFCRLKAERDDLVIIGAAFRLGGPTSKNRAALYLPRATLPGGAFDDADTPEKAIARHAARKGATVLHMDEVASMFPMLLHWLKEKGFPLPGTGTPGSTAIHTTPIFQIRRTMERLYKEGTLETMAPFLLFSSESTDDFFSQFVRDQRDWRSYFHVVDVAEHFCKWCRENKLPGSDHGLPVQFLVTTRASWRKHMGVYQRLLGLWKEWRQRNAGILPDDVRDYPPDDLQNSSQAFARLVTEQFSQCFSFASRFDAQLVDSDFELVTRPNGGVQLPERAQHLAERADAVANRARPCLEKAMRLLIEDIKGYGFRSHLLNRAQRREFQEVNEDGKQRLDVFKSLLRNSTDVCTCVCDAAAVLRDTRPSVDQVRRISKAIDLLEWFSTQYSAKSTDPTQTLLTDTAARGLELSTIAIGLGWVAS